MEWTSVWAALGLLVLAWAARAALKAAEWVWFRPRRLERALRAQGLQGYPYRILYGDLKDNTLLNKEARSKPITPISHRIIPRVVPLLNRTINQYGKISFIWYGPNPRIVITDPEMIREVLFNKLGHFRNPNITLLTLLVTGLANYEGEKWARHRRIINPAFHVEKLKCMLPAFSTCCSELIGRWESLIGDEGYGELDVWPEIQSFTGDAISRTAFGSSYAEGRRIFQLQSEQAQLLMQNFLTTYIPGYRFLPTTKNRRRKQIHGEVHGILRSMIEKRKKATKMGVNSDDLLGLLMESNSKQFEEHGNSKNVGMTTEDVIEECKLFYFAGQETTSVLLTWTMIMLSMYPSWQVRAREEVSQVLGKDKPDFDGLNRLKIVSLKLHKSIFGSSKSPGRTCLFPGNLFFSSLALQIIREQNCIRKNWPVFQSLKSFVVTMILYEVLRLYPPAGTLVRRTYKTTKLGRFTFPAEVGLSLPIIFLHRDPELWGDDVDEFNPERFSEGVSKASKNQAAFFPFGWGPRICIGQNFALLEAKMCLSVILQKFSFELSPHYVHAPGTVMTLQPQHGAQVLLHRL